MFMYTVQVLHEYDSTIEAGNEVKADMEYKYWLSFYVHESGVHTKTPGAVERTFLICFSFGIPSDWFSDQSSIY